MPGSTITKRRPVSQIGSAVTVVALPARRPPRTGDVGSVTGAAATRKAAARPKRSAIAARRGAPRHGPGRTWSNGSGLIARYPCDGCRLGVQQRHRDGHGRGEQGKCGRRSSTAGRPGRIPWRQGSSRRPGIAPSVVRDRWQSLSTPEKRALPPPPRPGRVTPAPRGDHYWPTGASEGPGGGRVGVLPDRYETRRRGAAAPGVSEHARACELRHSLTPPDEPLSRSGHGRRPDS